MNPMGEGGDEYLRPLSGDRMEDNPKATRDPEQLLVPLHENAESPSWLALSLSSLSEAKNFG